jgi:hypothetical protein
LRNAVKLIYAERLSTTAAMFWREFCDSFFGFKVRWDSTNSRFLAFGRFRIGQKIRLE